MGEELIHWGVHLAVCAVACETIAALRRRAVRWWRSLPPAAAAWDYWPADGAGR